MSKIVFSSDMLPAELSAKQRARAWSDAVAGGSGLDVDCPNSDGFRGTTELIGLPVALISRCSATSVELTRSRRRAHSDNQNSVLLLLNDGRSPVFGRQAGCEHVLREGDAAVLDFGAPYVSGAPRGGRALATLIPRTIYDDIARSRPAAGHFIDGRSEALRLLRAYLRLLLRDDRGVGPEVGAAASRHLSELLALALGRAQAKHDIREDLGVAAAAKVELILQQVRTQCLNPRLNGKDIGKALDISERTVQHLLKRAGTTLSFELREARLSRAETMLRAQEPADRSISQLAYMCGFEELSTFYRAFRERFGCTPKDLRARHVRPGHSALD